ncbi:MAG: hypothetical protein MJZ75_00780 [Paludibacteraceae bacterium]|nr:hypothetical protein [Paludibacteraceae bacterium]
MKKHFLFFVAVVTALTISADDCPWFDGYPGWGMSTGYNLNADSWEFNLSIYGDTAGAHIQWYVYDYDSGSIEDTIPTYCKGSNTVSDCHAATDVTMRNTHLNYVCVVKTPNCPDGITSKPFDVYVATDGDCMTSSGKTLNLQNVRTYTEGNKIALKATFNADGGNHHYIWYHNGVPVGEPEYQVIALAPGVYPAGMPTNVRSIVDYEDDYNTSYLTIPACEVDDQGTWQVRVWDGINSSGDTCSVWSSSYTMNITPVTQCPDFQWQIDGEDDLTKPMYAGKTYTVSVTTEDEAPIPALLVEAEGVIVGKPDTTGHTVTAQFTIDQNASAGTPIRIVASTGAYGIRYRACADSIKPLIKAYGYLVFDDNNNTHVWSDAKNWWPTYERIPIATDSAVIRKPCQVDITNAQVRDLTFEVDGATDLTILPTGALTIAGLLTNPQDEDILIQSAQNGNGALVLAAGNKDIPATVEFYARSKAMKTSAPVWQYMGYPLQDSPLIAAAYPAATMYEWTNTPNRDLGGNWQRVDSLSGTAVPFVGYCMTEDNEQVYTFKGLLNDPVSTDVTIPNNDQGEYPDFAFVANAWVAPIDIARMDVADFGAADATVYIMNTGTYVEAKSQQSAILADGTAMARGQYNAIPVHAASYLAGSLKVIPSMQGFFVHSTTATTLTLDYQKAVFDATSFAADPVVTRTPARKATAEINPMVCRLHVSGFGAEDNAYLLVNDNFTNSFENGWDGYQFKSDRSNVHLAVVAEDADLSVAAIPELEGQQIDFVGNVDKYYTLTVHCDDAKMPQGLYLQDMTDGTYTPMINGAQHIFTCTPATNRFRIVRPEEVNDESTVVEKFIHKGVLYIRKGNLIFGAQGQKVE